MGKEKMSYLPLYTPNTITIIRENSRGNRKVTRPEIDYYSLTCSCSIFSLLLPALRIPPFISFRGWINVPFSFVSITMTGGVWLSDKNKKKQLEGKVKLINILQDSSGQFLSCFLSWRFIQILYCVPATIQGKTKSCAIVFLLATDSRYINDPLNFCNLSRLVSSSCCLFKWISICVTWTLKLCWLTNSGPPNKDNDCIYFIYIISNRSDVFTIHPFALNDNAMWPVCLLWSGTNQVAH